MTDPERPSGPLQVRLREIATWPANSNVAVRVPMSPLNDGEVDRHGDIRYTAPTRVPQSAHLTSAERAEQRKEAMLAGWQALLQFFTSTAGEGIPPLLSFCTGQFFWFFLAVFIVYWLLPWQRGRVWLLLAASLFFYSSWKPWLAFLVAASSFTDYWIGRGLDAWKKPRARLLLVSASIIGNLGLLAYFKYVNFFLHSLEWALQQAGAVSSFPLLKLIAPIGISFYTFEAISYSVDVYRRRIPAERNLGHFMLFILFFPHLIAGPIVRARDFLPQIRRAKHFNWVRMQLGVEYFLMGAFKKLVIADRMALFVDPVFANPHAYGFHATLIAVLAYALQIYCDFSGYTDMAIGCGHLLGYKLTLNFNMPYLATNISEFWRRWHISLSSWLRDYLFIPLGGSRGEGSPGRQRFLTCRNLLITMILGGLWHGATWTFIVWGLLHGLYLVIHRVFRDAVARQPDTERLLCSIPGKLLGWVLTMTCVCVGWVFFRAGAMDHSFATAVQILQQLAIHHSGLPAPMNSLNLWLALSIVVVCHGVPHLDLWKRWRLRLPAPLRGMGYAAALMLALILAPSAGKAFIYFDF